MNDEHYIDGGRYQIRSCLDRRFWHCAPALHFGVVDDYGVIVPSGARPLDG